jgi:hypothetical protein
MDITAKQFVRNNTAVPLAKSHVGTEAFPSFAIHVSKEFT